MTATGEASAGLVAVIVNYNAASHLGDCLDSLLAAGVDDLIVVDNASTDGSRQVVEGRPTAIWMPMGQNLGYGAAANRGAAERPGRDLLVCNPDLVMHPGTAASLVAALGRDPGLGVVGPRLVNPDGSLYPSAREFPRLIDALGHGLFGLIAPRNRFTRRYRMLDWDHRRTARVDWVSGACFLARRQAWDEVGGFDSGYFMYMEDVDLCWRLGKAGWAVGYEPAAEVLHVQGVSASRHPYRMLLAHHRSMWRFARTTRAGRGRAALPVVAVGLGARLLVAWTEHAVGVGIAKMRRHQRGPAGPGGHQRGQERGAMAARRARRVP